MQWSRGKGAMTTEPKADEIEVTPEMIEAGADVIRDLEQDDPSPWYLAEAVYRAMVRRKRRED
jgi:hypothetical protein